MNEPLITELAEKLQDWGHGTINDDLFIGLLPEDVSSGLFLVGTPSPPPHEYIDTEDINVDIWYRTDYPQTGYEKLRAIHRDLHRRANWSTNNWYIYFSRALGSIKDGDVDQEGGKVLSISVQFKCRNLNNVS